MKNRLSSTTMRIALVVMALTATVPAAVTALTFDDILAQIEATIPVQESQLARDVAEERLALSQFSGDPRLTFTPSTTLAGNDGNWSVAETEYRGSLAAELPLGLSPTAQNTVATAGDSLTRAHAAEEYSYAAAYADLLSAYHAAWLA
ncbi:MAG: hypothetical protein R6U25_11605, partial [Alkalispirochaeta sp.]